MCETNGRKRNKKKVKKLTTIYSSSPCEDWCDVYVHNSEKLHLYRTSMLLKFNHLIDIVQTFIPLSIKIYPWLLFT